MKNEITGPLRLDELIRSGRPSGQKDLTEQRGQKDLTEQRGQKDLTEQRGQKDLTEQRGQKNLRERGERTPPERWATQDGRAVWAKGSDGTGERNPPERWATQNGRAVWAKGSDGTGERTPPKEWGTSKRSMPRIAAVVVPAFPVALFVREKPQYAKRAVVVADGSEEASEVIAYNVRAGRFGIESGMTVAQARVRADDLVVGVRNEEAELEQSSRLMNLFQKLTPFVEEDRPGRWYLDVAGLMLLYKTETAFARRVIKAVAEQGLFAQVGIAGNKYVAAVAAETGRPSGQKDLTEQRGQKDLTEPGRRNPPERWATQKGGEDSVVIVPDRAEGAFLRDLPIRYLPVGDDTREKLILLGVRTIGQVARFKGNELIERFGDDGYLLAELSHGDDRAVFLPQTPEEEVAVEQHLLFAVSTRQALTRQLEQMLQQLFARLKPLCQGCTCLAIAVTDESKAAYAVEVAVESPTLQTNPFLRQLLPALEKLNVRSGITYIRVTAPRLGQLLPEQLRLPNSLSGFSPVREQSRADRAHEYRQVYRYRPRYSVLPEQDFELVAYDTKETHLKGGPPHPQGGAPAGRRPYARPGMGGLRLFNPPKQVAVTLDNDRLQAVVFEGKRQLIRAVQ